MTVITASILRKFPGQPQLLFAVVMLAGLFQAIMGVIGLGQYIR